MADYGVNINLRVKGQSGLDRLSTKVKELTKSVDNIRQIDIMNPRNTGGKAGQGARNDLKKYTQDMENIVKAVNKAKGAFGETANAQNATADALDEYTNSLKIGTKEHKNALAASTKQAKALGRETVQVNKNTEAQIKNNKAQAQGNRLDKFNNKGTGAALKSGLISGAFPLLFGQGPIGGAAGFAGGFLGTKMGGQMGGFAGGLVATAVLQQITTATEKIKELGKALSVENFNLDPIMKAIGAVGTSTEKYFKLLEKVEGKQAAYNESINRMNSLIGEKGTKDIQEFTQRMQDMLNSMAKVFTRLGAGLAGIFNTIANSGVGQALANRNLRADRLKRAEFNQDPLMTTLIGKRNALTQGRSGRDLGRIRQSEEFKDLQNRIAGLQHFFDLQEKITEDADIQRLAYLDITKSLRDNNTFLQNSITLGGREAEFLRDRNKILEAAEDLNIKLTDSQLDQLDNSLRIREELIRIDSLYKGIANTVQSGLVDAIEGAINGTRTLGDVARSVFGAIQRQLIDFAATSFLRAIPGIGGFFANGGVTKPNKSYIVGERGPELFTPGVTGRVTPNHEMGGGSTNVVVNVDASGSSVQGSEDRGRELGRLISVAVQSELIQQKRPGGLLA